MAERLSKGKSLVVMLVLCFLAVAVGLVAEVEILKLLMFIVAAGLLLLFLVILVTWLKKTAGINKENFHQLQQKLKAIHQAITLLQKQLEDNSNGIKTQSSKLTDSRAASASSASSVEIDNEGKNTNSINRFGSLFAQGAIPSAKVIKQNASGTVGRQAAAIEVEEPITSNLEIVLGADAEKWTKNLAVIIPPEIEVRLAKKHKIAAISPNRAEILMNKAFDYIIVDERCSKQGKWANFLETFRLSTYLDLSKALRTARSRGSLVLIIEDEVSSSLTNSLREHADINLRPGHERSSDNYGALEVYRDLEQLTSEEAHCNG